MNPYTSESVLLGDFIDTIANVRDHTVWNVWCNKLWGKKTEIMLTLQLIIAESPDSTAVEECYEGATEQRMLN